MDRLLTPIWERDTTQNMQPVHSTSKQTTIGRAGLENGASVMLKVAKALSPGNRAASTLELAQSPETRVLYLLVQAAAHPLEKNEN